MLRRLKGGNENLPVWLQLVVRKEFFGFKKDQ